MLLNASSSYPTLHTSVCIVGAGPAGIACAIELARRSIAVILVESGARRYSEDNQAMSDADLVDRRTHAPMRNAVCRAFGGTSLLWGGRCLPLDPVDFAPRAHVPDAAWPISYEELLPHYRAACEYADCGSPEFLLERVPGAAKQPIAAGFCDGEVAASALERWSGEPDFGRRYLRWFETSEHATLMMHATCVEIDAQESDVGERQVRSIVVAANGGRTRICARRFVLACGGLEVTRLLLNANASHGNALGNQAGLLGRFYMGHLSGKIANVRFAGGAERTVWHYERDTSGFYVRRRFTFPAATQQTHRLLNTAMWLDNPPPADPAHGNGILSAAYLALTAPVVGRWLAPQAIADLVSAASARKDRAAHVKNVAREIGKVAKFVPRFAYQRYVARPRLPGFLLANARNVYALHYHAEQLPSRDSWVALSDETDRHGLRRLRVNLKFLPADAESVVRCHAVLDQHLSRTGAGRLQYWMPEAQRLDAVLAQAADGFHQIGTARMAARWQDGVVDCDCRVFGTQNLFVSSSAVFPTSGQANPTLTILALSVRLAGHLAESLA